MRKHFFLHVFQGQCYRYPGAYIIYMVHFSTQNAISFFFSVVGGGGILFFYDENLFLFFCGGNLFLFFYDEIWMIRADSG